MTREDKIERKQRRYNKRKEKDAYYRKISSEHGKSGASWGRKFSNGSIFICEMGYSNCELRGYCNGDC